MIFFFEEKGWVSETIGDTRYEIAGDPLLDYFVAFLTTPDEYAPTGWRAIAEIRDRESYVFRTYGEAVLACEADKAKRERDALPPGPRP